MSSDEASIVLARVLDHRVVASSSSEPKDLAATTQVQRSAVFFAVWNDESASSLNSLKI